MQVRHRAPAPAIIVSIALLLTACGSVDESEQDMSDCGNGVVDSGEACEDGNTEDGDGCSSTCQVEECGNDRIDFGEECDGPDLGGESCESLELGGSGLSCTSDCTLDSSACEGCGNGRVEGEEVCDDGDSENNDGCDSECAVEAAWECDDNEPSNCNLLCGNGLCVAEDSETSSNCPADCGPRWLTSGSWHSCVLLGDGSAACWGGNWNGELGSGSEDATSDVPVPVSGVVNAIAIDGGLEHTCLLTGDGTVSCWGNNENGELGTPFAELASSNVPVDVPDLTQAVGIAAGGLHTCAWLADGSARCWGANSQGQLGTGDTDPVPGLATVNGLSAKVKSMAAGAQHTCAFLESGKVECWGDNLFAGQLGIGSQIDSPSPAEVLNISDVIDFSAKDNTNCAALVDGTAHCWGYNNHGQIGNGMDDPLFDEPQQVSGLSSIAGVTSGAQHSCAFRQDGTAACWGYNASGQLGNANTDSDHLTPTNIPDLDSVIDMAGGGFHTCAVLTEGRVRCWGANWDGELGSGLVIDGDETHIPQVVEGF